MLDASSHLLELDSSQAMWRLRSATTQAFGVAGGKVDLQTQPIGPRPKGKRAGRGNSPQFDLRTELYRITGIDWAQVNGIDVLTAQTVIAEAGDLQAFASEKHFTSWLGLCPTNETSGGKVLNRRTRKVVNRAATVFRKAASTLLNSQSYLGAQYRRLRTRLGATKAITAMARKLACLFYQRILRSTVSRPANPCCRQESKKAWAASTYP
jgi:hypothetical protein